MQKITGIWNRELNALMMALGCVENVQYRVKPILEEARKLKVEDSIVVQILDYSSNLWVKKKSAPSKFI